MLRTAEAKAVAVLSVEGRRTAEALLKKAVKELATAEANRKAKEDARVLGVAQALAKEAVAVQKTAEAEARKAADTIKIIEAGARKAAEERIAGEQKLNAAELAVVAQREKWERELQLASVKSGRQNPSFAGSTPQGYWASASASGAATHSTSVPGSHVTGSPARLSLVRATLHKSIRLFACALYKCPVCN
jgi:hypothetical protein